MRGVAITGLGAVSCFGVGCDALRAALTRGEHGITTVRRFDLTDYTVNLGAMVPTGNAPDLDDFELCVDYAAAAIAEAVGRAGLDAAALASPRTAVVLGLSPIGGDNLVHELAEAIRARLGAAPAVLTTSTACCSSTAAIGIGGALIETGRYDTVIAGGAEAISPGLYAGFHALGVLAPVPCSPFSQTLGTTLGEGAGFVVLQRRDQAPTWLQGFGLSNDAWHETSPQPAGAGVSLSMSGALADGGALAEQVGYINAHGTGTAANDISETLAIRQVFGNSLPPVSSTKGHLGHAQAAAGSLEIIATLLCADDGTIPPTLRAEPKRARMPDDCVETDLPRTHSHRRFLKNSAAFGGANATVMVGVDPGPRAPSRPLWISGIAAVGRHGSTVDALRSAWEAAAELPVEPPPVRIRRVNTDGMDPSSRLATAATAAALQDAGIPLGRGTTDGIGVVGGLVSASPSEKARLDEGIERRGMREIPVGPFARLVLNAPPSAAARALGLRGPHTAVSTGIGSGLAALFVSALLAGRDETPSALVALGVHEPRKADPACGFGAAAVVLQPTPTAVRLASFSMGATLAEARADALHRAGVATVDLELGPDTAGALGFAPALDDMHRVVLAVAALRDGRAGSALIMEGGTAATAVVLTVEPSP